MGIPFGSFVSELNLLSSAYRKSDFSSCERMVTPKKISLLSQQLVTSGSQRWFISPLEFSLRFISGDKLSMGELGAWQRSIATFAGSIKLPSQAQRNIVALISAIKSESEISVKRERINGLYGSILQDLRTKVSDSKTTRKEREFFFAVVELLGMFKNDFVSKIATPPRGLRLTNFWPLALAAALSSVFGLPIFFGITENETHAFRWGFSVGLTLATVLMTIYMVLMLPEPIKTGLLVPPFILIASNAIVQILLSEFSK